MMTDPRLLSVEARRSGMQPCLSLAARARQLAICAPSQLSEAGEQSLYVHLHRFLAPLLLNSGLERVWVLYGFEGSAMRSVVVEVRPDAAFASDIGVRYEDLVLATRNGGHWQPADHEPTRQLTALVVAAGGEATETPPINAFVVSDRVPGLRAGGELETELVRRVGEALRAFRCNAVRMLFEDSESLSTKDFVYTLLERLPDLCGVDHSAALILTSSLDAMVLERSRPGDFELVAERLFFDPPPESDGYERLIGLELGGEGEQGGLLGHAFSRLQRDPSTSLHLFVAEPEQRCWLFLGEETRSAPYFATRVDRPQQLMTVLVPLLAPSELGKPELMGFLSLNWRQPAPISAAVASVVETLSQRLARALRRSSLFSLSARQLWLLEQVRSVYLDTLRQAPEHRLAHFIGHVNAQIAEATGIPCFAIGHVVNQPEGRVLRFLRPRGFTHFDEIDLPLDAVHDVHETSIACLAVRLGRPLTLAGGVARDGFTVFKNETWVNEEAGLVVDARRTDPQSLGAPGVWRKLAEYYKPSRDQSYATLAFPVFSDGTAVGVVAVEVNRDTDWLWWTGFGSYLFYRLLANDLGRDLSLLGL